MKKIVIIILIVLVIIVGVVFLVAQKREQTSKEDTALENIDISDLIKSMKGEVLKKRVPKLRLKSLDAEEISLSDYRGSVLFISVWYSGCPACQKEAPHTVSLTKHFANNPKLQFIGISVDDDIRKAKQFVSQYKLPFTNLHDPKGKAIGRTSLRNEGTPTTFIVSPDGYIIGRFYGLHKWSEKDVVATLKTLVSKF